MSKNRKLNKGDIGYFKQRRNREMTKTMFMFGIVFLIFGIGYAFFDTRMNLLTVIAIVGVLPAGKSAVLLYLYMIHNPVTSNELNESMAKELTNIDGQHSLIILYELVFTSYDKFMELECLFIEGNYIIGYTINVKTDPNYTEIFLTDMLRNDHIMCNIRIVNELDLFMERLQFHALASNEQHKRPNEGDKIKNTLLAISL